MKSPLIADRTSGRRRSSDVPVVRVRDEGERIEAEGAGSEVRWGFWERAVERAEWHDGGVIRVMSGQRLV